MISLRNIGANVPFYTMRWRNLLLDNFFEEFVVLKLRLTGLYTYLEGGGDRKVRYMMIFLQLLGVLHKFKLVVSCVYDNAFLWNFTNRFSQYGYVLYCVLTYACIIMIPRNVRYWMIVVTRWYKMIFDPVAKMYALFFFFCELNETTLMKKRTCWTRLFPRLWCCCITYIYV